LGAALAATMLIAGCGGDDGGGGDSADAEKEIQAVIKKALTVKNVEVECVETVTKNFISSVYRTLEVCKTEEAKPEDTKPPTDATASAIKVDGDKATANVAVIGGDSDGTTGEIAFAKEDGAWKVDVVSVAFLRSQARQNLSHDRGDALTDAAARKCIGDGLDALGDDEFKTVAYDGVSGRDNAAMTKLVTTCLAGDAEQPATDDDTPKDAKVSVLRQQFEQGIRESAAKDGTSEKAVDCVVKKLRALISDKEILELVGKGGGQSPPELTKTVASAMIDCDAT
jgi:hypothetical protein